MNSLKTKILKRFEEGLDSYIQFKIIQKNVLIKYLNYMIKLVLI